MGPVQCPRCGSFATQRIPSPWEWLWLIAAAGTFVMRLLLSLARHGEYRGQPGVYGCTACGRNFTCLL